MNDIYIDGNHYRITKMVGPDPYGFARVYVSRFESNVEHESCHSLPSNFINNRKGICITNGYYYSFKSE